MWRIKNKSQTKKGLKSKKGFTLIEILVTTSILGMIALAIFSTLAGGLNVYRRAQNFARTQIDILISLEKMQRDLRNVFSLSEIDFIGDTKKISFAGLIRTVDSEGNQNVSLGGISYYFDDETGSLIKEEQDYPQVVSGTKTEEGNLRALAFIESINFSYYYFNLETQGYDWKTSWDENEGIPIGVKIEVVFKDDAKTVKMERTILIPVAG